MQKYNDKELSEILDNVSDEFKNLLIKINVKDIMPSHIKIKELKFVMNG